MFSIGIVGAGDIVRKVHLPVLQNLPNVNVEWLFDAAPGRARDVGDAYGVPVAAAASPEELPDCDVVLLAVPAPVRADYLQEFARRGSAVFCEKPFALSAAEHQSYLDLFPPHRLGCGYMRRFYRSSRTIERLLERRWLGPALAIRVGEGGRSRGSGSVQSFLDDPRFAAAGGVLLDLGTHTLDLALRFANAEEFAIENTDLVFDGDMDRHAHARVRLGKGGIPLDYQVSWLRPQPNRLQIDFAGVSVWTSLTPDGRVLMGDPAKPHEAVLLENPVPGAATMNQAFALEWREFLDGLENSSESRVSARSALATTALAEGIRAHARASHA